MKSKKLILKRIISVLLFICIVSFILAKYGYVIRTRSDGSEHITGLTAVDNVDVVFIGSSVTHTSWLPYRAWDEYGMTSFDFASSGHIMLGVEVGSIRYIKHRQPDTKLFVIDTRSYLKCDNEGEMPFTKVDNMDYSLDRTLAILECYSLCGDKGSMQSPINYIFDVLSNQSNQEVLGNSASWDYIDNDFPAKFQGCSINGVHRAMSEPPAWTDEEAEMNPYAERCLRYLLEYAKKNDINVLFTLIPYGVSEEEMKVANTMEKIIDEYDGDYINLCCQYAPFEVDYGKDFMNPRHLNIFGAEKYTHYLGQYIKENYGIEDHRGDAKYSEWDGYLQSAFKAEASAEKTIESEIIRKDANSAYMAGLKTINVFYEWYKKALLAEDLSIYMVPRGELPKVSGQTEQVFKKLGFADDKLYYHWISSCGNIWNSDTENAGGAINAQYSQWTMTHVNDAGSVVIDGEERSLQRQGINVVAWDDNRAEVVDLFTLVSDGNGGLIIERGERSEDGIPE